VRLVPLQVGSKCVPSWSCLNLDFDPSAHKAAERAARDSYGRLLAILSSRTRDIALCEDALSDAFAKALELWPFNGIPDNPDAWLLTVARRHQLDHWRHDNIVAASSEALLMSMDEFTSDSPQTAVPDERLRLMFVCAHPSINVAARAPLMLQTVLGLDVNRMAGAFLTAPTTLAQRLVRAKSKIRDSGISFEYPAQKDLPERLQDVMEGIYAAFGAGWDNIDGADTERRGLTVEAITLCHVLCQLLPNEPEPMGLLALMLFCEARNSARLDAQGHYIALDQQDTALWNMDFVLEAESLLLQAAKLGVMGPYQLEAAIQSFHTQKCMGLDAPSSGLVALYDNLVTLQPTLGAQVSRVCAIAADSGAANGLAALAQLDTSLVAQYQPFWAVKAHLSAQLNRTAEAKAAYTHAIGLAQSDSVRQYLTSKLSKL
jgi:RNA polymerase sigma-70 factor, ECF subfamily